jgi:molecular chaperone GrpE (heat shock protein)
VSDLTEEMKVQLKEIELTRLNDELIRKQSDFEQWRRAEEKKHTGEYTKKWNNL